MNENFITRHRQLRISADTVLGLSKAQKEFMKNTTILVYGGASGYKVRSHSIKSFRIKQTKLLQSKSKQCRLVRVVIKR